jgi:hypothetical protein
VTVDLGDPGDGVFEGALSGGSLPIFGDSDQNGILSLEEDNDLSVTLNLDGDNVANQIGNVVNLADELAAAGIDYIGVNADEAGNITISDDQASLLVGAGLAFSEADGADDQITVEASAEGTHLKTSLQDLQKLGVDNISVSGQSATVDLGNQGLNILVGGSLPTFGDEDHDGILTEAEDLALSITLDLGAGVALPEENDPIFDYLESSGIDRLRIHSALDSEADNWIDLSSLQSIHQSDAAGDETLNFEIVASGSDVSEESISLDAHLVGIDLLTEYATTNQYGQLISTLSEAGVLNILVDQGNVKINDQLAKALVDAGMLQALPQANISLVYQSANEPYASLNTSLRDMAALGINYVDYTAVTQNKDIDKVFIDLGLPLNDVNAVNDVKTLLSSLDINNINTSLFNASQKATALVLNDNLINALLNNDGKIDENIIDGLFKLGIYEIDVLVELDLGDTNPIAHTGFMDGATINVNLIGTEDPEYDYLHSKYPHL